MKRSLAKNTGLSFRISSSNEGGNLILVIRPDGVNEGLFKIKVTYRNKTRLIMDFISLDPNFVSSFDIVSKDRQDVFVKLWEQLRSDKNCVIKVNEQTVLPDSIVWANPWHTFSVNLSKVVENDLLILEDIVTDWLTDLLTMVLSLVDLEPVFDDSILQLEGKEELVLQNRYERSPINRKLCLLSKGYACYVCGFDFERVYGSIGRQFIHVHHLTPLYIVKSEHKVDPLTDLIPVCPNCHYMLHKKDPPYTVEELQSMMNQKSD